jgi:hypothetical protein
MSAIIVELQTDQYRPYRRHGDEGVTIFADSRMLKEIETFASHARQATEHAFRPLAPDVRRKVLDMLAILKDEPR